MVNRYLQFAVDFAYLIFVTVVIEAEGLGVCNYSEGQLVP
jgi:hypothetical protein